MDIEERIEQLGGVDPVAAGAGIGRSLVLAVNAFAPDLRPQPVGRKRGQGPVVGFERRAEFPTAAMDARDLPGRGRGAVRSREATYEFVEITQGGVRSVERPVGLGEKIERLGQPVVLRKGLGQPLQRLGALRQSVPVGRVGKSVGTGHADETGRGLRAIRLRHERGVVDLAGMAGLLEREQRVSEEPRGLIPAGRIVEARLLRGAVHFDLWNRMTWPPAAG